MVDKIEKNNCSDDDVFSEEVTTVDVNLEELARKVEELANGNDVDINPDELEFDPDAVTDVDEIIEIDNIFEGEIETNGIANPSKPYACMSKIALKENAPGVPTSLPSGIWDFGKEE